MREQAVLFSEMTPEPDWEAEFNAWYDEEHIPLRMQVPGFLGAQRYRRNSADYLAVYDMEAPDVLSSPAYEKVKNNPSETTARMLKSVKNFSRYIGRQIGVAQNIDTAAMFDASVLYPVFFNVPPDRQNEFDEWYAQDHVDTLLEEPGWLGCRRFEIEIAEPHPFNRLALHYLKDRGMLECSARAKARASVWRERLAAESWFKGTYLVFDRHGRRFESKAD